MRNTFNPIPANDNHDMVAPWIRSTPFFIISISIIFTYVVLGTFTPSARNLADTLLTPVMNVVFWLLGNKINVCIQGPLPYIYYRNLIGLTVTFSIGYNLASIYFMVKNKTSAAISCRAAHYKMIKSKECSDKQAWLTLHAILYLVAVPIAALVSFILLNSVFGWFVFSLLQYSITTTLFICLCLVLPTCMCAAIWSIVMQYVVFDAYKLLRILEKGSVNDD